MSYSIIFKSLAELKTARTAAGLSLADVAERSGIDKAALSRLENGIQANPTVETLLRYAAAVGKRLRWTLEDVRRRHSAAGVDGVRVRGDVRRRARAD